MSTILEAVGTYLQTNNKGTLGTNIFLGVLPESPDVCIGVFEYEGLTPMFTMGTAGIEIDRPSVQLLFRATRDDYPTARDAADSARILLSAVANQTLSSIRVLRIEPVGSVMPMGVDKNSRPIISCNFRCHVEL
jgi:hypothetical protein